MPDPQPGQYVSLRDTHDARTGERVQVTHTHAGQVHLIRLDRAWSVPVGTFSEAYAPHPDGADAYANELATASQAVLTVGEHLGSLNDTLTRTQLALTPGGHLEGHRALLSGQTSAAEQTGESALRRVRAAGLTAHLSVTAAQDTLKGHRAHLTGLAAEAVQAAQALLAPIQAQLNRLQETVWTLELYAGSEEQITTLRTGTPAGADTPITVRQTVRAMDEESLLHVARGGMDYQHVPDFDAWLLERPEHLDQVLPEPKGVVALIARRAHRNYGSPDANTAAQHQNTRTHFLIRNGENLHRVTTDFTTGRFIVPGPGELGTLFEEVIQDGARTIRRRMTPGSAAFLNAERSADARRRHYYRVALILQGLLDRTTLFHPLPVDQHGPDHLNLTSDAPYRAGYIHVAEDSGAALDDQSEPLRDWLRRINADMQPGQRIVGHFYTGPFYIGTHRSNSRFSPNDEIRPTPDQPLTLEQDEDEYLYAAYPRVDRHTGRTLKSGRVWIKPTDASVLLIDHPDVTIQRLRSFMARRAERERYQETMPLLQAALNVKIKEREQEAPFLRGLVLHARTALRSATPQVLAEQTVQAYKLSRARHRSPSPGDGDALRACLTLMQRLHEDNLRREEEDRAGQTTWVTAQLLDRHPAALMITYRPGGYAVATPHRPHEHVYATVTEYVIRDGELTEQSTRPWSLLPRTWLTAHSLHRSARVRTWTFTKNAGRVFTDAEWVDATEQALMLTRTWSAPYPDVVIALTRNHPRGLFTLYAERPTPDHQDLPDLWAYDLRVSRTPGGVTVTAASVHGYSVPWSLDLWSAPVYLNAEQDARLRSLDAEVRERQVAAARAHAATCEALDALRGQWRDAQEAAYHETFLRTYGEDHAPLWPAHLKTLDERQFPAHPGLYAYSSAPAYQTLYRAALAGHPLTGLTLAQLHAWTQKAAPGELLAALAPELGALHLPGPAPTDPPA